jgi:CheY-like chemotaxis protein
LLRKNPARSQSFSLLFGRAHVFYPEATPERCTVALLVEIDPVGLVRNRRGPAGEGGALEQYVNDRPYAASFVVNGLKQNGFAVDHASDGENGLALAQVVTYDAAVLDIMLPKLDGLSLLRQLRQHKILTPVLILSAKASVDDRVKGLQAGGDDYLTNGRVSGAEGFSG